jgi:hypothetical protein
MIQVCDGTLHTKFLAGARLSALLKGISQIDTMIRWIKQDKDKSLVHGTPHESNPAVLLLAAVPRAMIDGRTLKCWLVTADSEKTETLQGYYQMCACVQSMPAT